MAKLPHRGRKGAEGDVLVRDRGSCPCRLARQVWCVAVVGPVPLHPG